jgi:hypothetical protein
MSGSLCRTAYDVLGRDRVDADWYEIMRSVDVKPMNAKNVAILKKMAETDNNLIRCPASTSVQQLVTLHTNMAKCVQLLHAAEFRCVRASEPASWWWFVVSLPASSGFDVIHNCPSLHVAVRSYTTAVWFCMDAGDAKHNATVATGTNTDHLARELELGVRIIGLLAYSIDTLENKTPDFRLMRHQWPPMLRDLSDTMRTILRITVAYSYWLAGTLRLAHLEDELVSAATADGAALPYDQLATLGNVTAAFSVAFRVLHAMPAEITLPAPGIRQFVMANACVASEYNPSVEPIVLEHDETAASAPTLWNVVAKTGHLSCASRYWASVENHEHLSVAALRNVHHNGGYVKGATLEALEAKMHKQKGAKPIKAIAKTIEQDFKRYNIDVLCEIGLAPDCSIVTETDQDVLSF